MDLFAGIKTLKKVEASAPAPTARRGNPPAIAPPPAAPPGGKPGGLNRPQELTEGALPTVGDGGASWKLRALKRAQERAAASGTSLAQEVHNYQGTSVQSLVDASKGAESWRKQNIKVNRACYTCGKEGHRAVDCPQGANKHGDDDLWAGRGRSSAGTCSSSSTGESRGGAGIRVGRQQTDGDVLKKFRGKVVEGMSNFLSDEKGVTATHGVSSADRGFTRGGREEKGDNQRRDPDKFGGKKRVRAGQDDEEEDDGLSKWGHGKDGGDALACWGERGSGEDRWQRGALLQGDDDAPRGEKWGKGKGKGEGQGGKGEGKGEGKGQFGKGNDGDKGGQGKGPVSGRKAPPALDEARILAEVAASEAAEETAAAAKATTSSSAKEADLRSQLLMASTQAKATGSSSDGGSGGAVGANANAAAAFRARLGGQGAASAAAAATAAASSSAGGGGGGANASAAAALRARLAGAKGASASPMKPPAPAAPAAAVAVSPIGAQENMWAAATAAQPGAGDGGSSDGEEGMVEVVAPLDAQGRRLRTLAGSGPGGSGGGGGAVSAPEYQKEDFKTGRWKGKAKGAASAAASTEELDVVALAQLEREGLGGNMDEDFARNVVRLGGRFKGSEQAKGGSRAGADEDDDIDNTMKLYQGVSSRVTAAELQQRQRQQAIQEHKKFVATQHSSPWSLENPNFAHKLVAVRKAHAYVMMVPTQSALRPGQCVIVAAQQAPSCRALSEDVFEQVQLFKHALRRLYGRKGLGCLFLETSGRPGSRNAWARVDCVPVPLEVEEDAPLYFKQALSAADEEWATHKALIDTSGPGGLRKCLPLGFPYFHVEWNGRGGGCAHIIEDADKFNEGGDFGLGVIAGMLQTEVPRGGRGKGGGVQQVRAGDEQAARDLATAFQAVDWEG